MPPGTAVCLQAWVRLRLPGAAGPGRRVPQLGPVAGQRPWPGVTPLPQPTAETWEALFSVPLPRCSCDLQGVKTPTGPCDFSGCVFVFELQRVSAESREC